MLTRLGFSVNQFRLTADGQSAAEEIQRANRRVILSTAEGSETAPGSSATTVADVVDILQTTLEGSAHSAHANAAFDSAPAVSCTILPDSSSPPALSTTVEVVVPLSELRVAVVPRPASLTASAAAPEATQKYDVVLMDLQMPYVNKQLMCTWKSHFKVCYIPCALLRCLRLVLVLLPS